MESKETLNIDYGLNVLYDGKTNILLQGDVYEYPVGGLICEYMRLNPSELKDAILCCDFLDLSTSPDNVFNALLSFEKILKSSFPIVISTMIFLEFSDIAIEWLRARQENSEHKYIDRINSFSVPKDIKNFIFENTPYQCAGSESVLQMFLSIYLFFAESYIVTKHFFTNIVASPESQPENISEIMDAFLGMYYRSVDLQNIDFRIILADQKLQSMYTIHSSLSLLLFEIAHSLDCHINFVKCPICKNYFVPEGRSDTLYCSYPSPQKPQKTCKEIGAQITRINKEKNDIVTSEYRKIYMKYKMTSLRHPENIENKKALNKLTTEVKSHRRKLSSGTETVEEFLDWLKNY